MLPHLYSHGPAHILEITGAHQEVGDISRVTGDELTNIKFTPPVTTDGKLVAFLVLSLVVLHALNLLHVKNPVQSKKVEGLLGGRITFLAKILSNPGALLYIKNFDLPQIIFFKVGSLHNNGQSVLIILSTSLY